MPALENPTVVLTDLSISFSTRSQAIGICSPSGKTGGSGTPPVRQSGCRRRDDGRACGVVGGVACWGWAHGSKARFPSTGSGQALGGPWDDGRGLPERVGCLGLWFDTVRWVHRGGSPRTGVWAVGWLRGRRAGRRRRPYARRGCGRRDDGECRGGFGGGVCGSHGHSKTPVRLSTNGRGWWLRGRGRLETRLLRKTRGAASRSGPEDGRVTDPPLREIGRVVRHGPPNDSDPAHHERFFPRGGRW